MTNLRKKTNNAEKEKLDAVAKANEQVRNIPVIFLIIYPLWCLQLHVSSRYNAYSNFLKIKNWNIHLQRGYKAIYNIILVAIFTLKHCLYNAVCTTRLVDWTLK